MAIRQSRLWPAVLLTTGALAFAGCGSSAQTTSGLLGDVQCGSIVGGVRSGAHHHSATSTAHEPGEVTVTVTEADGCVATPDTVPAGQVTFVITNVDALSVTEVELVSDQRIVGERENLAPGFDSTFSARLDGGSYQVFCPGAATEKPPFTVTGEAAAQSADLTALLDQATIDYGTYVDDQISFLLVPVQELAAAIKAGDLAAAQAAYIKARPFYERIEPVAESFPDLDPAIDLRVGDVEAGTTWTGFHPIEQGLFEKQSHRRAERTGRPADRRHPEPAGRGGASCPRPPPPGPRAATRRSRSRTGRRRCWTRCSRRRSPARRRRTRGSTCSISRPTWRGRCRPSPP